MNNEELEYDYFEDMPSPATMEKKKRKRRRIIIRVLSWALVVVLAVIIIGVIAAIYMVQRGGSSLQKKTEGNAPVLEQEVISSAPSDGSTVVETPAPKPIEWQSDWVQYGDTVYDYNENIMTFLFMGIDKQGEVKLTDKPADGGQSDALFLVVVNPDKEQIDLIGVNRDTMVDVYCYGYEVNGEVPVVEAQITTQHGFGDGGAISAERTKDAVSTLFYSLPINGYVSVGYDAIPQINDAVGGVDVECLEDMTFFREDWTKGTQLTLIGEDAIGYLRKRDTSVFESARGRLARQKQYLSAFVKKVVEATKEDISVPVNLYKEVSKYMTTDITTDQVVYLTSQLLGYSFGEIYTLEGETIKGERFEEFYVDYDKLKELMLQVFYTPVEMD